MHNSLEEYNRRHERSSRLIRNPSNCEREARKKKKKKKKKKIQASAGLEPVTSATPVSQRSRVRVPLRPEFFFGLLFRNCLDCVSTAKIFHDVVYS